MNAARFMAGVLQDANNDEIDYQICRREVAVARRKLGEPLNNEDHAIAMAVYQKLSSHRDRMFVRLSGEPF